MKHLEHSSQRGAALIMSLITVMAIASLGAGLVQLQSILDRKHGFSIDRRRALYIAEAGLAEAALAVSQGKSGTIASEAVPAGFGGGVFWVESIDLPEDRRALVCTARIGSAEFILRSLVVPNVNPVASLGFFGTQGVEIGWGTVADGYHSGRGDYVAQIDLTEPVVTTGDGLLLGSNGDIVLEEGSSGSGGGESGGESSGSGEGSSGGETGDEGGAPPPGSGSGGSPTPGGEGSGGDEPRDGGEFEWSEVLSESDGSGDSGGNGSPGSNDPPEGEKGSGGAPPGQGGGEEAGSGGGSTPPLTAPPGAPTRIYGRLRPGVDGVVRSNGFSMIEGRIQKLQRVPTLPAVTLPTCTEAIQGDLLITGTQIGIGDDVDTSISGSLVVRAGSTLTLIGPKTLDVDMLRLASGATLIFDDSTGPIDIYARRGVYCAEGSTWQSPASESSSRGSAIFVSQYNGNQERVFLPESGTFRGVLYAPSDAVVVPASLRWFGSIVSRTLRTEPGAHITFDRKVAVGGDGVPTLPHILSWQIVPSGEGLARYLAIDPVFSLQLQGVVPSTPSQAAPETDCEVQYVDLYGAPATHVGTFASLNTASVDRIVGIRWVDTRDNILRGWLRPAGEDPTGAISTDRGTLEELRKTIVQLGGETKVGTLDDAQVVEMISKVPSTKLALQPLEVQDANKRNSSQMDMTKYVDGSNNVKWTELFDDVSTRKEVPGDVGTEVPVAPGG